jgi:hypothetical protein
VALAIAGLLIRIVMISILSTLVLALGASPVAQADLQGPEEGYALQGDVNYVQLLDKTLRMRNYLGAPDAKEKVRLFTSNDAQAMRQVGQEFVMLEAFGPGMIANMHLNHSSGMLRFYVDGAEQPSWQVDASVLFSVDSPLPKPLVRTSNGVNICSVPMPFQKSIRVTTTDRKLAYEVAVRTMPAGVTVPSWGQQLLDDSEGILHRTARSLGTNADLSGVRSVFMTGGVDRAFSFKYKLHGNGIIQWLTFSFIGKDGPTEEELPEYLRHMRFELYEDADTNKEGKILVDVPFGDFFGTAPGTSTFRSWGLSQVSQAMPTFTVRYPMPYVGGFGIRITATRKMPKPVRLRCDVGFQQVIEPPTQRFRSKYFQMEGVATDKAPVVTLAELEGPGRLMATTLTVLNPVKESWGNGSIRISVDGETEPSWKSTNVYRFFDRMTRQDGPFEFGYNSLNRPFLNDAIPFQKDLKFDLELKHASKAKVDLSGVVCWYSPAEQDSPPLAYTPEQLIPKPLPTMVDKQVVGALEAENFRVKLVKGEGEVKAMDEGPEGVSGGMLGWTGAQKGEYIKLNFDVASTGKWQTEAQLYTYPGGPKVQIYFNGKKAGPALDLNAEEAGWKAFDLGVHMLANRAHLLTLSVDSEPAAGEFPPICMDFLRLTMK